MTSGTDVLIAQYDTMVNSALQVTSWRQNANFFYLTVSTALLSMATFISSTIAFGGVIALIAGILIAYLWHGTIIYYQGLNEAKFSIICEIEDQLPVQFFTKEWDYVKKMKCKPATSIERKIPMVFIVLEITTIAFIGVNILQNSLVP